jgi:hypothetical protein
MTMKRTEKACEGMTMKKSVWDNIKVPEGAIDPLLLNRIILEPPLDPWVRLHFWPQEGDNA